MQSVKVATITSNEGQVRSEIFSGMLPISEAGAELLRIERMQHDAERQRHHDTLAALRASERRVRELEAAGK